MTKIYQTTARIRKTFVKKVTALLAGLFVFAFAATAQNVTVTASAGLALRNYNTLWEAFEGINDGTHQGVIVVTINASTTEGTTPATLNSGNATPASYTSVTVKPSADGLSVTGNPAQGLGVVQLNGADNVIIDGDNPNTGGTNRNLSFVNSNANTLQFCSVIRIATSAAVTSANNITIQNCNINGNVTGGNANGFGASNENTFGIYAGGNGGATAVGAPTAITTSNTDFATAATTINALTITNNAINQCARGIAFVGESSVVCDGLTVTNNTIGNSGVAPATTVYSKGITVRGANAVTITGNTIQNILQWANNNLFGIEFSTAIGGGTLNISNNTISNVQNNGASSDARGIMINAVGGAYTISGNTISGVESSATGLTSGIHIGATTAAGTIQKNVIHDVYSRNLGGAAGINMANVANGMVIQNNFIYTIKNNLGFTFSTLTRNVHGILVNSGSNHKIYHNSIHLFHASTATSSNFIACLTINNSGQTGIDIRNNIFVNTVSGGTASDAYVAIMMPFAAAGTMNLTLNNNGYYTGSIANKSGIAFAGTNVYNAANIYTVGNFNAGTTAGATNWRNFSSSLGVTSNDDASFGLTTGHPFVSNTDLHVPSGASQSALESGGASVGVAVDIDNDVRPGPAGSVNGGAILPDIGADEFDRQLLDKFPPTITFTPPVVCGTGARTFTATISDATGVPTAGAGLPVVYWRVNAGAWNANTATYISPTQYQFTVDPGATALLGQLVEYYIVMQDIVAPPNVIASPSTGAGGYTTSPPAAGTPPTTFYSYTVTAGLAGVYTVGAAGTYPTLTAAVAAYNASCLGGAVTFNLIDATYPSETYPITINHNTTASAINTLTIKPAAGVTATISGNNGTALIKFNGSEYVTIDGSNNGSSSQNLTIQNTNANNSAAVIWIANGPTTATDGANFNTIKNTIISGNTGNTTLLGILSGGNVFGNNADAKNNNNTINNCIIRAAQYGIGLAGNTGLGLADQNWTITNNFIGSTTIANDKIGFRGIALFYINGFTITGNTIAGVIVPSGFTSTASGISIFSGVFNGTISHNKISDIKQQDSGGWGSNGIFLGTENAAAINIHNNFIWDVSSVGFGGVDESDNGYGMMVYTGSGYNIYYNSISMATSQTNSSSITAAINISTFISDINGLNIRNNIFSNTQSVGTRYAIYSAAPASVYQNINYNDYYFTGAALGFLSSARANLSAWQTATGKDANSVSIIPNFISATDLHLQTTSLLNGLATPIAGITTDIDGTTRSVTVPDIGADEFNAGACSSSSGGIASASPISICGSGTVSLSASGYSLGDNIVYQWQSSPDNSTWSDIVGQTNAMGATSGTINTTTYFRLKVTCGASIGYSSNTLQVIVNNPQVLSATPSATRCGTGTVTLTATGSAGTTLDWYATATGGSILGSGGTFTTPTISASTTFYVAAQPNPPAYPSPLVSNYDFSASTGASLDPMSGATVIMSDAADLPAGTNGDDDPSAIQNIGFTFNFNGSPYTQFSASPDGWILLGPATPVIQFTNNVTSTTNVPKIYPYWDDHATGSDGDVSFVVTGSAPNRILKVQWKVRMPRTPLTSPYNTTFQAWLYEGSDKIEFRYGTMAANSNSASVGLTAGAANFQSVTVSNNTSSNGTANNSNSGQPPVGTMYTFNPPQVSCQSPRTAVPVTVTAAPAISASATPPTICQGQSTNLNVTSANSNYGYTWTPGPLSGASQTVSPLANTTYTVTALDPGTLCQISADVVVVVNTSPSIPVVSNDTTICLGGSATLTATSSTPSLVSDYNFAYSTGATLDPMTGATTIVSLASNLPAGTNGDDDPSAVTAIGFTFNFNNTTYTQFSASPDGWIKLGGGAAVAQFTNNVTSTTNIPKIYPFWDDHSTGSDGAVSYLLTGSAPNRILKVQWKIRMPRLNLTDPSNTTFQAWLYEFDGKIEFRYGTMAAVSSDASVGLTAGAANFQSVTVSTNTTSNTVPNNTITGQPAVGTMYTFTPQIPTITWSPNVNLSSTTGSPVTASPISTQTYTATATGTNGCPRSSNVTVTVQSPTASVSIVASPSGAICSGTSVTFTATPTNGGTSPVYQWYVGATPVGANSPTYTTTTLNNGDVVTVKMTSNLTPCAPPQVTSNAITMTVNPNLPVSVTIAANPGTTICSGVSVTFTATPTNGGGSPTYQWYEGVTPVGSNSPTYTTAALTNGVVVTCVLTSNATCATGSPATSNALTMTVNPNLPVSVSIVGSNAGNPICTGTSVTFTATPTNGGGGPTYQWYVGATPVGSNSPTYTTTTLANGDVVTCVLTSNATCPTGSPATSNAITMTVTGSAPAAVTLTPSAACAGQTITLTANPTNQGATPTYEFFVNTISVQNGASATYTYTPIAGDQAYVVLTSSLLCPNPNNATSATITINPQAAPVIAATATCTTLYSGSGQQTTLSANATTATGTITSYQWNIGGVPIGGATAATYTTSVGGSYTVTVGNSNGCFTTNTGSPIVISVVTTPLPAGTYTIPGTACNTFTSIATAITYINTYGVSGSGGVIFSITGGYTETTPVGGFRITAKGTAANNIIFQKASGANPVITAAIPNAGSLNDAIFKLVGADYIVIRSLTLQEHATAANTTPGTNNQTEWGVALLQASLTDGSQNDSIVGNTISLNRNYANSFGVYSNATHSEVTPSSATAITNATGSHSNNRILSNIISNVNVGIAMVGSASGGFYDSGNDIGGSSSTYGNTITNWGGAGVASSYANIPSAAIYGILDYNQLSENVSYNTLTSASFSGTGVNTRGILKMYSTTPTGNTFTTAITNNSISISAGFTTGAFEFNAIRTEGITAALATATINVTNNTILNCSTANGSTPTTILINNLSTNLPGTMNINDNIIKAFNSLAVAGTFTGISSTGAIATISISNNQIGDNVANDINTSAGTITGILNTTGVSATKTMSGNQIRNLTGVAATTAISTIAGTNPFTIQSNIISTLKGSNVVGITLGATAGQVTLTGNNISNLSGTGQINGFTVSTGPTVTIDNNTVSTLSTTSASAFVTAVQNSGISTITNNVFSNLSINSGAPNNASVYGILQGGGTPVVIAGNTISGLTSNSISGNGTSTGLVDGVYIAAGTNVSVRKNRIFDLSVTGASATTTVYGVHIAAGTSDTIHNNYISDLRAPSSSNPDAIRAIGNTNATASANYFVYYNTIYLKATSSQTTFGTSGIYHNAQATSTTSQLFLRNNIIVNESTPGSTSGITVAIRRSGANLGNYNTASNNNALYAGIASAKNLLYYDGTNSSQTLAQMQGIASFPP
ncbi:MAG: right-handed parallel beta-helix repeat-containing protein, partial [Bacteroidetes bacterium]|nr:right-handed parallel beta-helix repeat-containing protein [Bacteroidota bacterium]